MPASKLLRLKILVDDINNNRQRIKEIFQRFDDAQDNNIWKNFVREGLISDEQFEKLIELEDPPDLEEISTILKSVKIGQGIPFLPTAKKALRQTFDKFWKDGAREKVIPILEELLRRGVVTDEIYSILVNGLNNL